ncbi:MAG TPA: methylated-DNA--[protein]-cysteine S-methyltransferase, partial [Xanthomonadales bacterium]|nr:methylated-DNA--[protein]-cysteine S-methyltransferase [Xanthomonadales bacterium]
MNAVLSRHDDPLARVRARIEESADSPPSLETLARELGTSPSQLTRAFRARYGLSPKELAQNLRRERLKRALRDGPDVTDAIYAAGFGSSSRVYEASDKLIGMTPGTYRAGAKGVEIRWTTLATPLGTLLVAATARGLCAVTLGEDVATLEAELAREFPAAARTRVDEGADEFLASVVARVARGLGMAGAAANDEPLPADLRATAFQWQVWQALTRIPRGETRSYADIARAIGRPTAVRAVARACASNRLALVVPCHRVVRTEGGAGGYRWGTERKARLLATERESARV